MESGSNPAKHGKSVQYMHASFAMHGLSDQGFDSVDSQQRVESWDLGLLRGATGMLGLCFFFFFFFRSSGQQSV